MHVCIFEFCNRVLVSVKWHNRESLQNLIAYADEQGFYGFKSRRAELLLLGKVVMKRKGNAYQESLLWTAAGRRHNCCAHHRSPKHKDNIINLLCKTLIPSRGKKWFFCPSAQGNFSLNAQRTSAKLKAPRNKWAHILNALFQSWTMLKVSNQRSAGHAAC
jgi:hypothetical protein